MSKPLFAVCAACLACAGLAGAVATLSCGGTLARENAADAATEVETPRGSTAGDAADASSPAPERGADASGETTAVPDASSASDSSTSEAASSVGYLELVVNPSSAEFLAGFGPATPSYDDGCAVTSYGECAYFDCPLMLPADAAAPPTAGTLTLMGGSLEGGVAVAPGPAWTYDYMTPSEPFAPGDAVGVSATGGAVPAFPTHTVSVPGHVSLTAPAIVKNTVTVDRSLDLLVTWTGGQPQAQLAVVVGLSHGSNQSVRCLWDATLGQGTIPQAALAQIVGTIPGAFDYGQWNAQTFTAGTFVINEAAFTQDGVWATFQ